MVAKKLMKRDQCNGDIQGGNVNSSCRILCAEKDEDYGASLNVIAEFQRSSNGLAGDHHHL
jgi:hypothetical protein